MFATKKLLIRLTELFPVRGGRHHAITLVDAHTLRVCVWRGTQSLEFRFDESDLTTDPLVLANTVHVLAEDIPTVAQCDGCLDDPMHCA
jgi:hypothetical protein